ncbi:hypothetical protein K2173_001341 [Erythroxylum novogranatense]|uniref:Protein PLASTID MOVEMENT IMPAIRED 2 n=1 Tax=Erythroxylum novogranatense TaxID=1862640 RepID=A0AAV8T4V4_9ROSI|nr:hypothetical protein K2173_001341 [Erythroxylum novogranatense]
MDRRAFEDRRRIGSVKAAINMYGERILERSPSMKKAQMDMPEKSNSRTKELHMAKRDVVKYRESRKAAESVKAEAESELLGAKNVVKSLAQQIEESNSKVKSEVREMERIKKSSKMKGKTLFEGNAEGHGYAEVVRELEYVKQELCKLKVDMASVKEEKMQAEKEMEASSSKFSSNLSSVEVLRKEIEEANEEQVLVELARIEASKEYEEIKAQSEKEVHEVSAAIEERKRRIRDTIEEIDQAKDDESRLIVTLSDVNVLQNELKHAKEMEKKVKIIDSLKHPGGNFRHWEDWEGSPLLRSITEELNATKKELISIREESFQFMASMDIIRDELKHVSEETARLKKTEEKADLTVQNLNSKLLRAKSKLEAATAAEEKAKSVVSNLSLTLEQLKTEAEVAKKEKALVSEETATIKAEILKTESEIDLSEERLQVSMQELEAAKTSEASALDKLKRLIESTMQSRASISQHNSSITISKFEYDYLTGSAVRAEEIADKKVAAAQAWIEALKASEKETLMKIEMAEREIREMRLEEEREVSRTERSLSAKKVVEGELKFRRQKHEKSTGAENLQLAFPRSSSRDYANLTPSRRTKVRNSGSPAIRTTPRSTVTIKKKKKKVVPNLANLFAGKKIDGDGEFLKLK